MPPFTPPLRSITLALLCALFCRCDFQQSTPGTLGCENAAVDGAILHVYGGDYSASDEQNNRDQEGACGSEAASDADNASEDSADESDETDDAVSVAPPFGYAPLPHLFLGLTLTPGQDLDHTTAALSSPPHAGHLVLTMASNLAFLTQRSQLKVFLMQAAADGIYPVVSLASLFDAKVTDADEVLTRLADPVVSELFFSQLQSFLDIAKRSKVPISLILEPFLVDSLIGSLGDGFDASRIPADTGAVYRLGYLSKDEDPTFPDTLRGLVQAASYLIFAAQISNLDHGWQISLRSTADEMILSDLAGLSGAGLAAAQQVLAERVQGHLENLDVMAYDPTFLAIGALDGDEDALCFEESPCSFRLAQKQWDDLSGLLAKLHNESDFRFLLSGLPHGIEAAWRGEDVIDALYQGFVSGVIVGPINNRVWDETNDEFWFDDLLRGFDTESYLLD